MSNKRKVEVFTAGCALCDDTVNLVKEIACESCEVEVLDMREPNVAKKASDYGITAVPSVVINGKLAACCSAGGIKEQSLRTEGVGVSLA